jgi:hypothetical protein
VGIAVLVVMVVIVVTQVVEIVPELRVRVVAVVAVVPTFIVIAFLPVAAAGVWEFLVKVLVVLADVYINVKIVAEEEDQEAVRDIRCAQEDTRYAGEILHAGPAAVAHIKVPPEVEDLEEDQVQVTTGPAAVVV